MYTKINERKRVLISSKEVEIPKENKGDYYWGSREVDGKFYIIVTVAFCPYCGKMELVYKFFKPIREKENIIKKLETQNKYFFYGTNFKSKKTDNFYEKIHKNFCEPNCYIFKCPNCNHDLSKNPIEEIFIKDKEKRNAKLFGYDVYKKDNKIIIRGVFKYLTPNTYLDKIFVSFFDIYVSMNLETGQTFIMAPLKNGKTVRWMKRKILNITYSFFYISFSWLYQQIFRNNKIKELVLDILKEEKSIKVDDKINFRELILLNRIPFWEVKFIRELIPFLDYWQSNRFVRKLCGNIKVNERFDINNTIKKFRIPNKPKIRRMITDNPMNLFYFAIAKRIGFTNYDLLIRIVEQYKLILKHFPYVDSQVPSLVKLLIKEKGEAKAFSCIFSFYDYDYDDIFFIMDDSSIFYYLKDTYDMYSMLKAAGISINFSGNITDIHDRFSSDIRKIKSKNLSIEYTEKETLLIDEINNIKFSLPKDTYELIDIGQSLHICVGSYGKKALTKKCTIVTMEKDGAYIGCLELLGHKLIQAKAVCNNLLQEIKAETLKIWVEKHKINTDNCFDYYHIKDNRILYDKDKIYQNKTRYENF